MNSIQFLINYRVKLFLNPASFKVNFTCSSYIPSHLTYFKQLELKKIQSFELCWICKICNKFVLCLFFRFGGPYGGDFYPADVDPYYAYEPTQDSQWSSTQVIDYKI